MSFIYQIKHLGKPIYVGQTNDFVKRKKGHIYKCSCDTKHKQEIHRFIMANGGFDNFSIEPIISINNQNDTDKMETFWIKQLHTHRSEGGLNQDYGGKNSPPNLKGKKRPNISAKLKGKLRPTDVKLKISTKMAGKKNFLNKHHSNETKRKISVAITGRSNTNCRKLSWYDAQTIRYFNFELKMSQRELSRIFRVDRDTIKCIICNETYRNAA